MVYNQTYHFQHISCCLSTSPLQFWIAYSLFLPSHGEELLMEHEMEIHLLRKGVQVPISPILSQMLYHESQDNSIPLVSIHHQPKNLLNLSEHARSASPHSQQWFPNKNLVSSSAQAEAHDVVLESLNKNKLSGFILHHVTDFAIKLLFWEISQPFKSNMTESMRSFYRVLSSCW